MTCFCYFSLPIFDMLLSLNLPDNQYLIFHRLKITSLMITFPFFMFSIYDSFFPRGKKIIPVIFSGIVPFLLVLMTTDHFLSLPIREVVISTNLSVFTYHFSKTNIVYSIYSLFYLSTFVSSIIYYFLSKTEGKRSPFVYLLVCGIIIGVNDNLVSHQVLNSIMLADYYIFIFISILFVDFLLEDRKAYIAVVDLSKELNKHKEELEIKVEERTRELRLEKEKSDRLLLNVLPEPIAIRLKEGETQIADHFEEASVIFIDIVDFTKLSAKSTPQKMVKMLNDVFTIFDKVSAKYGIEKIKTIGDCYMAASGIPVPRADHAQAISMMALDAMEAMKSYKTEDGHEIQFRIGLDCGPIVAGVIGEQKFIYDLWGDMVNTASRMETNGIIGKIQCTERFRNKLNTSTPLIPRQRGTEIAYPPLEGAGGGQLGISFVERGEIEIKGKGMMKTYFLEATIHNILI